jgi:outer membrane biosynthesis protein TonB
MQSESMHPIESGLDQNAIDAVRAWKFTSATRDGKPVPVQFEVSIGFDLY